MLEVYMSEIRSFFCWWQVPAKTPQSVEAIRLKLGCGGDIRCNGEQPRENENFWWQDLTQGRNAIFSVLFLLLFVLR